MKRSPPSVVRPVRAFVLLAMIVFALESAEALFLSEWLARLPTWLETGLDALLLTAVASGFIWVAFVAPLRRELHSARGEARLIMDTASDAIVTIDERGIIRAFNRSATRLFGYGENEALERNVSLLMPEPDRSHHDRYLRRYLESGEKRVLSTTRQVEAQRKDGTQFTIEMSLSETAGNGTRLFSAIIRDVTERRATEARIYRLAHFDELTGLPNRALLRDRLEQAIALARRQKGRVGVLYFDLDRFKPVNDEHGHYVGDRVLQVIAERLHACVRESDTAARVGGDEFAVVLPLIADHDDAARVAAKVEESISAPITVHGRTHLIGASVGIALFPDDAKSIDALLNAADLAMYRTKRTRAPATPAA